MLENNLESSRTINNPGLFFFDFGPLRTHFGPLVLGSWARLIELVAVFSFLYFKKIKFQKYMPNSEIFKNGCLSPPTGCLSPIQLATGPKFKKKYI